MSIKWFSSVVTITLFLLIGAINPAISQSLAQEQTKLSNLNAELKSLATENDTLTKEIASNKAQLEQLSTTSSPEKEALDQAKANLAKAEANDSPENQSVISNAKFKLALAERKYKKANSQQFELSEKIGQLESTVAQNTARMSELESQISTQQTLISQIKTKQLAEERALRDKQQQLLEQQKLEAEKAKQEVARLKALLEAEKAQEQAASAAPVPVPAAAPAPASTAATPAPASTPPASAEAAATEAPAAEPISKPQQLANEIAEQKKSQSAKEPSKAGTSAILLTSKDQVQAEQTRLNTLLEQRDRKKNKFNKILNIKPASGEGETEAATLKALGHDQYRGANELKQGDFIFVVGFYRWRQTIENDGEFQFILDASDPKNPRLVYFNKALGS